MYSEIGTASGVIVGMILMVKFLNAKIDKKQNKEMCKQIHGSIEKGLSDGNKKFDKIMDKLEIIGNDNAAIKNELKHMNGNS